MAINFYYWWEAKGLACYSALVYVERNLTVCCSEKGFCLRPAEGMNVSGLVTQCPCHFSWVPHMAKVRL